MLQYTKAVHYTENILEMSNSVTCLSRFICTHCAGFNISVKLLIFGIPLDNIHTEGTVSLFI